MSLRRTAIAVALLGLAGVVGLGTRPGLRLRVARAVRMVRDAATVSAASGPSAVRASTPPGVSVWVVDDSTKVFRGEDLGRPRAVESKAPVHLEAARAETVAFQVAVASAAAVGKVDVELTELSGPAGRIPRERMDVMLESYVECGAVEDKVVSLGPGDYPDALIPLWDGGPGGRPVAAPFPLVAGQNQVLWVDVKVPREAAPGLYAGRLTVLPEGLRRIVLPVEVQVHPFEIPRRTKLTTWVPVYSTRLFQRESLQGMEKAAAREVLWRYYRMAHDHRFVTQIMEERPELKWDTATGALQRTDWSDYDALNGPALDGSLFEDGEPPPLWKVGGFVWWGARPGDPPHFGGNYQKDADLTPAHRRALVAYAREIAGHFRERGWNRPKTFMYMIDEPDFKEYPQLPGLIKAYGDAIHESGTGIAHLVTTSPEVEAARGAVDIWASWGSGYHPRAMKPRQDAGERAWFYQQHEPFVGGNCVNNEGLAMRSWPWIAWRYGVDGIFLWVGNFWNEDPYRVAKNWNANLLGNGVLFYPGARLPSLGYPAVAGPVSSFRMKALRRGLYDYEYFQLLETLGGDADPMVAKVVRSALNEEAYQPYWNHPRWGKHGDWSHDPAQWDGARREAAREILKRLPKPTAAAGL